MKEQQLVEIPQPEQQFVKKKDFEDKQSTTKSMLGLLIGLTAVFLGLVVLAATVSVQAATSASSTKLQTEEVRREIRVHVAAQSEKDLAIVNKLDEISSEVKAMRKENSVLTQKVIEHIAKEKNSGD
jgi:hypothetical protein